MSFSLGSIASALSGSGILDKAIDFGINNYMFNRSKHWQKEQLTHAHQWEVQDLKNAGLNPILSANTGASGASAPAWAGTQASSAAEYIQQGRDLERKDKQIKNETEITKSTIAMNKANTARALALLPEEIKTHQFNRSGRIKRELGEAASNTATEIIEDIGWEAGTSAGAIERKYDKLKTLAKKEYNKAKEELEQEEKKKQPSKWKNYKPLIMRQHYD